MADFRLDDINIKGTTHRMVQFGEPTARPPQFGKTKAAAIVGLADADVDSEVIKTAILGFGMYKLKDVEADIIIEGARALCDEDAVAA
jgi:hypothetical protein